MTKGKWRIRRTLPVTLLCLLAAACSGGGGGGDDAPSDAVPAAYTGARTQAVIDQANAETLALDAYAVGGISLTAMPVPAPAATQVSQVAALSMSLAETVRESEAVATVRPLAREQSTCGDLSGYMEDSVAYTQAGDFSGEVVFHNYCEEGVTLNGRMQVTGNDNVTTGVWQATINTEGLTVATDVDTFTAIGSLSVIEDAVGWEFKPRLVFVEGGRQSYMDYTVTLKMLFDADEMRMSGRYYDSEYGYVDFATEAQSPIKISFLDGLPSGGIVRFTGANGTWATLTFKPSGVYEIVANGTVLPPGSL